MSKEHYDDACPDCQPVLVNADTGKPLPADSREMQVALRLWDEFSLEDRRAWHRVTCNNAPSAADMSIAQAFSERIRAALVS